MFLLKDTIGRGLRGRKIISNNFELYFFKLELFLFGYCNFSNAFSKMSYSLIYNNIYTIRNTAILPEIPNIPYHTDTRFCFNSRINLFQLKSTIRSRHVFHLFLSNKTLLDFLTIINFISAIIFSILHQYIPMNPLKNNRKILV